MGVSRKGIRSNGVSTFAEHPDIEAPAAKIIWRAEFDPATLIVAALPVTRGNNDTIEPWRLAPWLTIATGDEGGEHAVLSDGRHHIRLDIAAGSLSGDGPVRLHYRLHGVVAAASLILPLRRLLDFCRYRRFAASLYPRDPRIARGIVLLRVRDALAAGASQREIASVLFGEERVRTDWNATSDALRSQVRRLVVDANAMAAGAYRELLRRPGYLRHRR